MEGRLALLTELLGMIPDNEGLMLSPQATEALREMFLEFCDILTARAKGVVKVDHDQQDRKA